MTSTCATERDAGGAPSRGGRVPARVALAVLSALALVSAAGCRALDPPARPEATCARACEAKAKQCTYDACVRGCNIALDKLLEREGEGIVACVARAGGACNDPVWAKCAVRTGVHADGGPPAPPPPQDYEAEDDSPPPKKNDDNDLE